MIIIQLYSFSRSVSHSPYSSKVLHVMIPAVFPVLLLNLYFFLLWLFLFAASLYVLTILVFAHHNLEHIVSFLFSLQVWKFCVFDCWSCYTFPLIHSFIFSFNTHILLLVSSQHHSQHVLLIRFHFPFCSLHLYTSNGKYIKFLPSFLFL